MREEIRGGRGMRVGGGMGEEALEAEMTRRLVAKRRMKGRVRKCVGEGDACRRRDGGRR